MARYGYPKAIGFVFLGFGLLLLVKDVLNGSPDPPFAFLFGHHAAKIFEQVIFWLFVAGLVRAVANWEPKD